MASRPKPIIVSNPFFNAAFVINLIVFFKMLLALVSLAFFAADPMTKAQEALLEIARYALTGTIGVFLGLAGGKSSHPDFLAQVPPATKSRSATKNEGSNS